jgi:hypothetical protein
MSIIPSAPSFEVREFQTIYLFTWNRIDYLLFNEINQVSSIN